MKETIQLEAPAFCEHTQAANLLHQEIDDIAVVLVIKTNATISQIIPGTKILHEATCVHNGHHRVWEGVAFSVALSVIQVEPVSARPQK